MRLHRANLHHRHAAHSRQALSDGALLRLVLQQDARSAQEACRGGKGEGRQCATLSHGTAFRSEFVGRHPRDAEKAKSYQSDWSWTRSRSKRPPMSLQPISRTRILRRGEKTCDPCPRMFINTPRNSIDSLHRCGRWSTFTINRAVEVWRLCSRVLHRVWFGCPCASSASPRLPPTLSPVRRRPMTRCFQRLHDRRAIGRAGTPRKRSERRPTTGVRRLRVIRIHAPSANFACKAKQQAVY